MKQVLSLTVLLLVGWPLLAEDPASVSSVRPLIPASGFGPDSEVLVPVVINSPGLNGTFFKTDGFFANFRNLNQEALVRFIPQGVSAGPPLRETIGPLTNISAVDLLGPESDLSRTGVGSLLITAVQPGTSTVDTGGQLHSSFRIWTQQPGSAGTTSFGAWGPPSDNIHGFNGAIALGLRQNAAFRTNFGIVNLDPVNPRSWTVTIRSSGAPTSLPISLQPLSMQLVAVPTTITPSPDGYLSITFLPAAAPGTDFRWSAFGVTADNITGDSWLSLATQAALLPVNAAED